MGWAEDGVLYTACCLRVAGEDDTNMERVCEHSVHAAHSHHVLTGEAGRGASRDFCFLRQALCAYLQMHISNILAERHASLPVNDLNSDRRVALGFEHIINQVFGRKVDVAAAVMILLTQHTLWVKTAQAPAGASTCLATHAKA